MFPKEAEPPPCFILETDETVRLPSTIRPRNMSQLTLVSLRLPHASALAEVPQAEHSNDGQEGTQAPRDDCDDWQLVHRRVSVSSLLAKIRRRPRRPSLPVVPEGSRADGSTTMLRERLRRLGQMRLHSLKGWSAVDVSRDLGKDVEEADAGARGA